MSENDQDNSDDKTPQPRDRSTEQPKNRPTAQPQNRRTDVWEEEIDLREVGRGIAGKWYLWIGLPLILTVLAGFYFMSQPDKYRLTVLLASDKPEAIQQTEVQYPSQSVLRRRLLSLPVLRELYPDYFTVKQSQIDSVAGNIKQKINFSQADGSKNTFELSMKTTHPDSTAVFLNSLVDTFLVQEHARIEKQAKRLQKIKQSELRAIRSNYQQWRKTVANSIKETGEQRKNSGEVELVKRLTRNMGPVPEELEILQRNQQFLKQIQSINNKLFWIEQLRVPDLELYEVYPAQSPGEQLQANRLRNTILAGTVSFLLIFFGVVFWEIL